MTDEPIFLKDPLETKMDLYIDWADWLLDAGDTSIVSATVTSVPTGITVVSSAVNGTRVDFRLSGGTLGATYRIRCQIVTNTGHDPIDSLVVKVAEK